MYAEQKFVIVSVCLGIFCLSVVILIVFIAFWPVRVLVGLALLALFILVVVTCLVVTVMGSLNEQLLRHRRVRYHEELPLGANGKPLYLYDNMKLVPPEEEQGVHHSTTAVPISYAVPVMHPKQVRGEEQTNHVGQ